MHKTDRWFPISALTVATITFAVSSSSAQSQRPTLASGLPESAVRMIEALMAEKRSGSYNKVSPHVYSMKPGSAGVSLLQME